MQPNWEQICSRVREIAVEAGAYISAERQKFTADKVESKGVHDFVSYVDKGAEKHIIEALAGLIPEVGFIAEEGSGHVNEKARYQWIIDPLDGTTNFVHGMPPYAVSIALWDANARAMVVGVVYEVTQKECFYSWKGAAGAYLNDHLIRVSDVTVVADSLIISGLAYGLDDDMVRHFTESFDYFNRHSHGARRLGSAATDLIYVACGRAEAFYQVNLSPWDVAAGAFIVLQAGGRVTDFRGGDDYIFGRSIVATNAQVWHEVYDLVAAPRHKDKEGIR